MLGFGEDGCLKKLLERPVEWMPQTAAHLGGKRSVVSSVSPSYVGVVSNSQSFVGKARVISGEL